MSNKNAPFHPIIYVRGYAMTPSEIDQTTADPFCGFNVGSTVYRAVPDRDKQPRRYIFESPLVRLAAEFAYLDVYEDGIDILDPEWGTAAAEDGSVPNRLESRSIVIFRYYDEASRLLGIGRTPKIDVFAKKLGELILRVRALLVLNPRSGVTEDSFRCYLVAHSMGGLVCRAFLQNAKNDPGNARRHVDKFFTYATPHNGIEMAGVNVPKWLGADDINNFNREVMADYLDLAKVYKATKRVDWLPEKRFPAERVFCMVGSNRMDYEVAMGLSRTFVGHGSDGLVRIENATLCGLREDGRPGQPCAKAFAYRAHSGFFGVVNSEESFQNLTRFLFGDVRIDIWIDVEEIRLPEEVRKHEAEGREVDALYQFELLASPRGKLWYLTRRIAEEDSVACMRHRDWKAAPKENGAMYVSTVFLANHGKVNTRRRSLAYSMTLGIRVPDYEIERKLWVNDHYEGGYLFRDALVLELLPPKQPGESWRVRHAWQNNGSAPGDETIDTGRLRDEQAVLSVPFDSGASPGIRGAIRLLVSAWNRDAAV